MVAGTTIIFILNIFYLHSHLDMADFLVGSVYLAEIGYYVSEFQ